MAMNDDDGSRHARWAHLRFSIIGPLLAAPPPRGELAAEIARLAAKTWLHPINGGPLCFGFSTIEKWLHKARGERTDPVAALRRRVRKDAGRQRRMPPKLVEALVAQHQAHRRWSYQLHSDNLEALVGTDGRLGPMPSYSTVLRYMKAHGLRRQKIKSGHAGRRARPGAARCT